MHICWNALCVKWIRLPKDGYAAYQVVVGVMYLLADDWYVLLEQEPGDGF